MNFTEDGGDFVNAVKELCACKVNLYLDVTGKREDGFHTVRSLMHSLSLSDEVTVSRSKGTGAVSITVEGAGFLPTDDRNLAVRAAKAFILALGITDNINITLKKNIPVAAGLAGGSTDAAGVLRALNKLYRRPLTRQMLIRLASELGSDVPYCLIGGSAICEGRGEILTRVPDISLHTVVAISDEHISTPEAYRLLDGKFSDFNPPAQHGGEAAIAWFDGGAVSEFSPDMLYNIFEEVILPSCDKASEIKRLMLEYSAKAALMSGSGPSVFGIFNTEGEARACAKKLSSLGYFARYARSV